MRAMSGFDITQGAFLEIENLRGWGFYNPPRVSLDGWGRSITDVCDIFPTRLVRFLAGERAVDLLKQRKVKVS